MSVAVPPPSAILATGLLVWLVLLMLLVIVRMLRGDIAAAGMLTHQPGDDAVTPERVLHMAAFPVVVLYYIQSALGVDVTAAVDGARPSLPDIPSGLVMLLTGTNLFYLVGKLARGGR